MNMIKMFLIFSVDLQCIDNAKQVFLRNTFQAEFHDSVFCKIKAYKIRTWNWIWVLVANSVNKILDLEHKTLRSLRTAWHSIHVSLQIKIVTLIGSFFIINITYSDFNRIFFHYKYNLVSRLRSLTSIFRKNETVN